MSHLLIPERPIFVLPSLVEATSLKEAIFIQQLHYRLQTHPHERDGESWIYNTYEDWVDELPLLSLSVVKRVVKKLRDRGVIVTSKKYNQKGFDRTLWYRIDYDALNSLLPKGQSDTKVVSKGTNGKGQSDTDNTIEDYIENNIEKDSSDSRNGTQTKGVKVVTKKHNPFHSLSKSDRDKVNKITKALAKASNKELPKGSAIITLWFNPISDVFINTGHNESATMQIVMRCYKDHKANKLDFNSAKSLNYIMIPLSKEGIPASPSIADYQRYYANKEVAGE